MHGELKSPFSVMLCICKKVLKTEVKLDYVAFLWECVRKKNTAEEPCLYMITMLGLE